MTLETLKARCDTAKIKYAYGKFKDPQDPSYLVAITQNTSNFMADGGVYCKKTPIQLDYVFKDKDLNEQATIENDILADLAWNKSEETYLPNENVWQVSYFFEI